MQVHRSTLKKIGKRGDLPSVAREMDWVFFCAGYKGRWRWGNPRRLYGAKTRQEQRAEINEREQRKEMEL